MKSTGTDYLDTIVVDVDGGPVRAHIRGLWLGGRCRVRKYADIEAFAGVTGQVDDHGELSLQERSTASRSGGAGYSSHIKSARQPAGVS